MRQDEHGSRQSCALQPTSSTRTSSIAEATRPRQGHGRARRRPGWPTTSGRRGQVGVTISARPSSMPARRAWKPRVPIASHSPSSRARGRRPARHTRRSPAPGRSGRRLRRGVVAERRRRAARRARGSGAPGTRSRSSRAPVRTSSPASGTRPGATRGPLEARREQAGGGEALEPAARHVVVDAAGRGDVPDARRPAAAADEEQCLA